MHSKPPSLESLFASAIQKSVKADMLDYVDAVKEVDANTKAQVKQLIEAHCATAQSFLESPAAGVASKLEQFAQTMDVKPATMEAGLSAAFDEKTAVVVGGTNHSVLQSLSAKLGSRPKITLKDDPNERSHAQKPSSKEIPRTEDDSRYQIHGEIAQGGMGAVLKGRDVDLGRDLAIKVLLDRHKDNPDHIERFVEEAQIGGQLQHPGIVPIYELGQFEDERPFFTMKLVKGETLAAILAKRKSPDDDLPKLVGIFEQVCQTMAYAHSKGVIHRDLKPANIMVGAFGEVQVMDWGLSKVIQSGGVADEKKSMNRDVSIVETRRSSGSEGSNIGSDTMDGSIMGTPAYMPPEQAHGETERLDTRSDVFGLGAILAQILTGSPAYAADSNQEALRLARYAKLDDCYARIDASSCDAELNSICKKALSTEQSDRQFDAAELCHDVTEYLEGVQQKLKQTELARVKAETRTREEKRRKKLYLAISGLFTAFVASAAIGALLYQARATEQKENELKLKMAQQGKHQLESLAQIIRLSSVSKQIASELPTQSLLLAIESVLLARNAGIEPLPILHESLLEAVAEIGGTPIRSEPNWWVKEVVSSNQNRLAILWIKRDGDHVQGKVSVLDCSSGFSKPTKLELPLESGKELKKVEISRDGRTIATMSIDGEVIVWQLSRLGLEIDSQFQLINPSDKSLTEIRMSHNGEKIVTVRDGWASVSTIAPTSDQNHDVSLRSDIASNFEISPNGRWLIGKPSDDKSSVAQVWDLDSAKNQGSPAFTLDNISLDPVFRFSQDGRWLACKGIESVLLFDFHSDQIPASRRAIHGSAMGKFNANGDRFFTGGATPRLYSLSGQDPQLLLELTNLNSRVNSVGISPNGRWLVTATNDKVVRAWDLDSVELESSAEQDSKDDIRETKSLRVSESSCDVHLLKAHASAVHNLIFTTNSRWLVTGGNDGNLRAWDLTSDNPSSTSVFRGHLSPVYGAAFSPDGRWAITGSEDTTARLWDMKADLPNHSPVILQSTHPIREIAFTPDSKYVVTAQGYNHGTGKNRPIDTAVRVWDLTSNNPADSPMILDGHDHGINFIEICPKGRLLATAGRDGKVCVWDLWAGADQKPRVLSGHQRMVIGMRFSKDGKGLFTGTGAENKQTDPIPVGEPQCVARYWDLSQPGAVEPRILKRFGADEWVGEFLLQGQKNYILTSAWLNPTHLWELDPNSLVIGDKTEIKAHIFMPPAVNEAVGLLGAPEVFDFASETPQAKAVFTHNRQGWTKAKTFSRDGAWYASVGGLDNSGRISKMSAADPQSSTLSLRGHSDQLTAVAISPDNRWVLTGCLDGNVRLWELELDSLLERAQKLAGRSLTVKERERFNVPSVNDMSIRQQNTSVLR